MLFITDYTTKPHLTRADGQRLMDEFAKRGAPPGQIAHYVRIDGGGVVISESDDAAALYEYILAFDEFLDFEVSPGLTIDDAVGPILASLAD